MDATRGGQVIFEHHDDGTGAVTARHLPGPAPAVELRPGRRAGPPIHQRPPRGDPPS
ncbi:MAG: hypothetical protein M0T71_14070 [Actinomycetota bacterium]|nr:hypothetical protein [Actinomycetota bacterium]